MADPLLDAASPGAAQSIRSRLRAEAFRRGVEDAVTAGKLDRDAAHDRLLELMTELRLAGAVPGVMAAGAGVLDALTRLTLRLCDVLELVRRDRESG